MKLGLLLLSTLTIALWATAEAGDKSQAKASSTNQTNQDAVRFETIVNRNFDNWDTNHSGKLDATEINTNIQDPSIKGEDAAALSAIKVYMRSLERLNQGPVKFSLDSLSPFTDDTNHTLSLAGLKLISLFSKCATQIDNKSIRLFTNGTPHLESIVQGKTGDCYFLATVGGMAYHSPSRLKDMIMWLPNGSYLVKFPGHNPIPVPAPTDCEIACYDDNGGDGLWFNVLQKAYALFKNRTANKEEALDSIIRGGSGARMIMFLTGNACIRYPLATTDPNALRRYIQDALTDERLVNTGTTGHCLTVLSYNPSDDTITIWNPWGSSGFYKTAQQKMNHGIFTMPFTDFTRCFISIAIEQDRPATARDYYNLRHHR